MKFKKTSPHDFAASKGTPGNVKLFVNNVLVTAEPIQYSLSGDGLS